MTEVNHHHHMRDYDRLAKLFDQRLGLYARESIEETLEAIQLTGNETILDACCATGETLHSLAMRGHKGDMIGIDFSERMLNVATKKLRSYPQIHVIHGDIHNLPFPSDYFPIVLHTNAFHYIDHPEQALAEFHRVLRPDGRLIFTDLAANSRLTRAWSFIRQLMHPGHYHVYRQEEAQQFLEKAGFVILRKKLWRINLFWSIMLFEAQRKQT